MSTTELNNIVGIAVGILAFITAVITIARAIWTYQKNKREAHQSKVQNRIEYLKEQMKTLQKALIDFDPALQSNSSAPWEYPKVIGSAKSAMLAVGHAELDDIAARMNRKDFSPDTDKNTLELGIKRLARIIAEESTK
jgi:hypothetical protein